MIENKFRNASKEPLTISKGDFGVVVEKFKKKQTKSYDFLIKSNKKYQEAIFKFCKRMIEEEEFPKLFDHTVLQMIWKQKASAEVLKNNRFIHMKEHYLPRTVESLVVNKMKDDILAKSTIYQIGGKPGHSIDDHLFSMKSLIELMEARGQGMIFTFIDIIAFFDREDIYDVIETLLELGVNSTAARLWLKLNQNTQIRIKTSAGMTESAVVGDVIGQGTAWAALVSQLNLDHGLHTYFGGSKDEMYYGGVRCEYFAYQDDIGKPSEGVNEAQVENIKLSQMFKDKGLEAHPDKTCFVVFGSSTYKDTINRQLEANPLYFGDFPVKRKDSEKYLGQIIHSGGLRASCAATISDREGKIKGAIFETQSIIEEFRMQAIGGMMAAYELCERAMVPSLQSSLKGANKEAEIKKNNS